MKHQIILETLCPMCGFRGGVEVGNNCKNHDLSCLRCTEDGETTWFSDLTGRILQVVESDPSDKIGYIATNYEFMKQHSMLEDSERIQEAHRVVKNGFANDEIYNLCDYIAKFISPRMSAFRKLTSIFGAGRTDKEIRLIDTAFKLYERRDVGLDSCDFGTMYTKIARAGLRAFGKYFGALWD